MGPGKPIVELLEAKVAAFIQTNGLFTEAPRVLLAVSGGADSIALLHTMKALASAGTVHADLVCVHINHRLRGSESDGDERFVIETATALGLDVVFRTVDVKAHAKAHKLSLETAARQLRLKRFAEAARANGCKWIATGHQQDDNAETVLQRLSRGTGFRGLAAIAPTRKLEGDLWLARPLLDCRRSEIVAYLESKGLPWREDRTNTDCAHTRNFVRHRLLPALERQSVGSLVGELAELAASAWKLHRQVQTEAQEAMCYVAASDDNTISIGAKPLATLPEIVAVELLRLQLPRLACGERDLTRYHYQGILELARRPVHRRALTLPGGLSVRVEYGNLIFQRQEAPAQSRPSNLAVTLDIPGAVELGGRQIDARMLSGSEITTLKIKGDKDPFVEYLDFDCVSRPLLVRRRRPGDRFWPLGLAGVKKLGKFLTAAKVPDRVRRNLLVFDDGARIVWVCPIRINEEAKVTRQTRRILRLRVSD